MRRGWPIFPAFFGVTLLLAAGCNRGMTPVSLTSVVIDAPASFDGRADLREGLRKAIEQQLQEDDTVSWVGEASGSSHRLRVVIGHTLEADSVEAPALGLQLEVMLAPRGDDGTAFRGGAELTRVNLGALVDAFSKSWTVITHQRKLAKGNDAELIKTLNDGDPAMREFATDALGQRRAKSAVDALCDRLAKEEQPALVLRTIGSLVAIGDTRAVEPLIDLTRRQNPAFVLQVVFAVGAIGGRTAEAFLVTLAGGHPSPEVQRGAKDALDGLKRRSENTSNHTANR